jgi:phage shock protein C
MTKRLYRSSRSKILGGVCGGLGEYFDLDPTLIRLFAVLALFFSDGAVFVAYIVAWIIMPLQEPDTEPAGQPKSAEEPRAATSVDDPMWHSFLPGVILIALGGLMLLREYFYWWDLGDFWPVVLIILGVGLIVFKGTRRNGAEASGQRVNGHPLNGQNGGGAV